MKALLVLLFLVAICFSASAQGVPVEVKKKMAENFNRLQRVDMRTPVLRPGLAVSPGVYKLPQDQMPCVVPNTNVIVRIPNALPQLIIPDVAAIPNPLFKDNLGNEIGIPKTGSK